jgi:SAM-dependent methyltransferase
MDPANLQSSYDHVAPDYAAQFFHELDHKPLDRALLDCFAELIGERGPVADIGCGPGQIGRYLYDHGLDVLGIDLSPEMVALAARLSPDMIFHQGSMLALDVPDAAWAGIVAFYSVIHLTPEQLPHGLGEFYRVLRPGGRVLLSFHIGQERLHRDELFGHPVDLDFQFYESATLIEALEAAGFTVEARLERRPYTEVEHPSRRGYLLAQK